MIKETTNLKKSKGGYMGGSGGRKKSEMIQYYNFKKIKEIFLNVTQNDTVAYFCTGWKQIGIMARQLHGQNRRTE